MKVLLALAFVIAIVSAQYLPGVTVEEGRHLLAQRTATPLGFLAVGHPAADDLVHFRVHLERQHSLTEIDEILADISNPQSPIAGKHLTLDAVRALYAPRAGAVERTVKWLLSHGVSGYRVGMDVVEVTCSVAQVEKLFGAKMALFESLIDRKAGGAQKQMAMSNQLTIPKALRDDVALVTGLTEVFHVQHPAKRSTGVRHMGESRDGLNGKDTKVTPSVLRSLYGVDYTPTSGKAKQCIGSFGSYYNPQCLASFVKEIDGANYGHINKSIGYNCWGNGNDAQCTGVQFEADLDVDYSMSMAKGIDTWVWQSAANATDAKEWMLNWAMEVNNLNASIEDAPQVFSISYGLPELWQCQEIFGLSRFCDTFGYDSAKYVAAVDAELQKMALRGMSVMVATGDDGAAGDSSNLAYDQNYQEGVLNQLMVTVEAAGGAISLSCAVPLGGMGRGALCSVMNELCPGALQNFVSNKVAEKAGCSLEMQSVLSPGCSSAQPTVSSNCSIAQFPSAQSAGVQGSTCTVSAYDYLKSKTWDGADSALLPNYPGCSPYITAVGATMLTCPGEPSCTGPNTEVTCSSDTGAAITSGGYFSPLHPRPAWQEAAVSAYLSSGAGLPPANVFNGKGRASPDVAVMGHNFVVGVYQDGSCVNQPGIDGTSASSPSFAGMVSLINDARFAANKGPIGFLNPHLYSGAADMFNDITTGSNKCRQITQAMTYDAQCQNPTGFWVGCSEWGFPATKGYDASTGLGSPKFDKLMAYLVSLP